MVAPMQTRQAEWIWRQRPQSSAKLLMAMLSSKRPFAEEKNRFVYFRKGFELPSNLSEGECPLHISADGRYQLFVNGQFVGRGPARCDPAWQYYDSYDIRPLLQAGKNTIAVLAHSYGRHMSWYQLPRHEAARALGCGGIFVQAEIAASDELIQINSDASWRYLEAAAWERDTPVGGVGFTEIYDARLAPQNWQAVDFDDSAWQPAEILSKIAFDNAPPIKPFPVVVQRDIPPLLEKAQRPAKLHRWGEVVEATQAANIPRQIAAEPIIALELCQATNVETLVDGSGAAQIKTAEGRAVALVFDFGRTVTGRPRLEFSAPDGAVIDVGFSERLQDDHIEPQEPYHDIQAQNIDRLTSREGRQQWERFEWSGFRYMQLTIRNAPSGLTLHSVDLNFTSYPVEQRGSFESSDELLNRIWQAGAYTVQLCMQDGYIDCPSREQRQWVGDAYVESLINFVAFGDKALTAKLLRQVAQSQRADGMTQMTTPGEMAAEATITIPDYCLYWLMTIREYVRYTGDRSIVPALFPSIERALSWFVRFLDDSILLNNLPHWLFVDWAQVDKRGVSTIINAQYYRTLLMCAELAEMLEAHRQAQTWRTIAERVKEAINVLLWDEQRGVYVDSRANGQRGARVSQHANGICLAYGIAPQERWERMVTYITDPARVKLTALGMGMREIENLPDFDEAHDVVLAQPFFMHHVNRGLVEAGRVDLLLANIRQRWGEMLASGGTTIWEGWQWFISQCHGWSATPTFDLSSYVLGIQPLTEGFLETLIAPNPGNLAWVRGTFPTPHGDIAVSWQQDDQNFELEISAPPNISPVVALPFAPVSVEVNGQAVELDREVQSNTDLISWVENRENSLWLWLNPGEKYRIVAVKVAQDYAGG